MTNREKEILKKSLDILKRNLKPRKIILFGSRAKGKAERSSDFDFAVECSHVSDQIKRETKEDIENVSGLYHVDIIYLSEVDDEFKKIILKTGEVIYGR